MRDKILFSAIRHWQMTFSVCLSQSQEAGKLTKMEDSSLEKRKKSNSNNKSPLLEQPLSQTQRATVRTVHLVIRTLNIFSHSEIFLLCLWDSLAITRVKLCFCAINGGIQQVPSLLLGVVSDIWQWNFNLHLVY